MGNPITFRINVSLPDGPDFKVTSDTVLNFTPHLICICAAWGDAQTGESTCAAHAGCAELVGVSGQLTDSDSDRDGRGPEEDTGSCLKPGGWTHLGSSCWQGRPLP